MYPQVRTFFCAGIKTGDYRRASDHIVCNATTYLHEGTIQNPTPPVGDKLRAAFTYIHTHTSILCEFTSSVGALEMTVYFQREPVNILVNKHMKIHISVITLLLYDQRQRQRRLPDASLLLD